MVPHSLTRVVLVFVGMLMFFIAITFNSLAGFGAKSGVFKHRTEDVTVKYTTPITPAPWALFMWDYIYLWIFAMFMYFLVGLCRRNAFDWMYTTPSVLPYGFHVSLIANVSLNISWLFLFDREKLLAGLIISALMTVTDYMTLFFSCHGLKVYGAWLNKYHSADLWSLRILVQNGLALYATFGTLFTLLNLTMFLQHQTGTALCDCTMLSMLLLLMTLVVWFLLENLYLDEHVRYILTIYPVVILWVIGVLYNSSSTDSQVYLFSVSILVLSSVLFAVRLALVTWKHHKRPLYKDSIPSLSPVEIALTQRKIFL